MTLRVSIGNDTNQVTWRVSMKLKTFTFLATFRIRIHLLQQQQQTTKRQRIIRTVFFYVGVIQLNFCISSSSRFFSLHIKFNRYRRKQNLN